MGLNVWLGLVDVKVGLWRPVIWFRSILEAGLANTPQASNSPRLKFRAYSRHIHIQVTLGTHSSYIQVTFGTHSSYIQVTFRWNHIHIQVTLDSYSSHLGYQYIQIYM